MERRSAAHRVALGLVLIAGALAGCQTYEPAPLDATAHRVVWSGRSPIATEVLDAAVRLGGAQGAGDFSLADGLSLFEAEAVALAFNPELRAARARAGVAGALAEYAGMVPDPELGVDIGRILANVSDRWLGSVVVGFTVPISGRLDAERALAGAGRDAELLRVYAAEWRIRLALREAWAEWSIWSRKADLLGHFVEELSSLLGTIDAVERAGEIAPVDARLFALEHATRVAQRVTTSGEAERARARIFRLLGLEPRDEISLVEGVAVRGIEPTSDGAAWASLEHPDVLVAEAEYAEAERALALEVRKQYPDLVIGPGYGREDGDDRVLLGVSAPIPLFNRNRQGVEAARAQREAARVVYETTLERLEADLLVSSVESASARATRETLERDVSPLADRQHREALLIARSGEVDTLLLLESMKRRFETRLAVLDALRHESLASIGVDRALGPAQRGQMHVE